MALSRKLKNTRIVSFKEDYKSKAGRILYAKGDEAAMHVNLLERLEATGAKVTAKKFDEDHIEKARNKFEAARQKALKGDA